MNQKQEKIIEQMKELRVKSDSHLAEVAKIEAKITKLKLRFYQVRSKPKTISDFWFGVNQKHKRKTKK